MNYTSTPRVATDSDGSAAELTPADFDATANPIISRHWFGVEPLRPIGSTIFPVVRCFESLQEANHAAE